MRKLILLFGIIFILSLPATSFAFGLEFAGGGWYQKPTGTLSFDKTTHADDLDLEDDLNYDDKWKAFGRLIIDMPLFFPNILRSIQSFTGLLPRPVLIFSIDTIPSR